MSPSIARAAVEDVTSERMLDGREVRAKLMAHGARGLGTDERPRPDATLDAIARRRPAAARSA